MSVAREMAKYAIGVTFQDLEPDEVYLAKRFVLDTMGCAIGGYPSEACRILQEVIKELDGPKEATVIGSGLKTSCLNATLINGTMVRYLDYNDTALIKTEGIYREGYHPSEVIPLIFALGEREHLSGKDAITAMAIGYDLSLRFMEGIILPGIEKKGFNGDTRGAYIMPIIAGKILGLSEVQMENSVGISGSCHAVFGILDAAAEEYTMAKSMRFPTMASNGIFAAMLAKKGFTGPPRMIEGHDGFVEAIMKGEYDINRLIDQKRRFAIRDNCIKPAIGDYSTQGHLAATLTLVKEHDIKPDDVAEVRVTTSKRCADHTGDPVKKYPTNKESADHSSYYLTAIAIIERQVGPGQFSPERYQDPKVRNLIDKVVLQGDPDLEKVRPAGISEIVTKQGATYRCRVDYPKGHPLNPMTDEEIIDKFQDMAEKYMNGGQMKKVIDTIFELDQLDDIGKLNRLMVFKKRGRK